MSIVHKILETLLTNHFSLKVLLNLHTLTYRYCGIISAKLNNNIHPKHRIMRYKEWFCERIQPQWVVLDVGCSTGMMVDLMSQTARFVYGIEIDPKKIAKASSYTQKNVSFLCADATIYDYSTLAPIDCITLSNVLEHIQDRKIFLKKLISQVKWAPTKKILIRVPAIDRDWITIYKKELGLEWRLDPTHYTEYTFKEFTEELESASILIENYEIRYGEIYAVCTVQI